MSTKPLAGRRVIELGTMIAAPFATHILAQLGAEVIKIEPPSGDTTRALVRGGPSGTFIAYNHSKKAVCLDLTSPAGIDVLYRLAATADVIVHNLSPAATQKLKITPADLSRVNDELIYCHIRGYAAGPQHNDLSTNPVAEAATGVMDDHRVGGRPSRLGPSYHDQFAGAYAVINILSALMKPDLTPEERYIEIGLYETGLHLAARDLAGVQLKTQLLGRPEKEAGGEFAMPGYGAYQTSDSRWVYLLVLTDPHWQKLTSALDMPEASDAGLMKLRERKKQRERVEASVREAVAKYSYDDAAKRLQAAGLGFTEVLPLERVLDAPQAQYPGKLRHVQFRSFDFEIPDFPGQLAPAEGLPPPQIGEHSLEILRALGIPDSECTALLESGAVVEGGADNFAYVPVREAS